MKNLKKLLLGGVALAGVVVFVISFFAKLTLTNMGGIVTQYKGIIWGGSEVGGFKIGAAVVPLIGAILVLVAALCLGVMAIFGKDLIKDDRARMLVFISAAALMLVGGILFFFSKDSYIDAVVAATGAPKNIVASQINGQHPKTTISVLAGIGSIVASLVACGTALFVKDEK